VYDSTDRNSLKIIDTWIERIGDNTKSIPIILVGIKLDLADKREVSSEDALMLNELYNLSGTIEICAKTGENVEEMFIQLGTLMLKR